MNPKRWHPELIALIVAAFATRLWSLFTPNAVVFDEVYFKAFAAHYLDGKYYFDIHPPLGKLLLSGLAYLQHLTPGAMLNDPVTVLRVLPAAAGILIVPLMWGILRRLGASRPFAFLGAFLLLFDNAILVESRFILMDSMLILFGLAGIYFYLLARDSKTNLRWALLALAAVSAGASASIKWTGLNSLAIILLLWLWDQPHSRASWYKRLGELALLALVPIVIYISVFFVHFQLLPSSGDGDAFMSPHFQSTLVGNPNYTTDAHMSFMDKFIELNHEMYQANQTLTATHPYGSHWYTWPLEQRPIYYWQGETLPNGSEGNIYMLGNPAIWWGLWIAILGGLSYLWVTGHKLRPRTISALAIAVAAYFINLMPFVAVARVMFLYHYFFSLFFSIIFVVMLWNDLATNQHGRQFTNRRQLTTYGVVLGLIFICFLFFSPLTYGTPLSPQGLEARMWLHSWR
jgi:dolichyl-phosphate-mannose-protein mannosyltransferase